MIYKAYKYRLYPTEAQKQTLAQHFGAVRFVYNWGLETKKKAWEESKERVSWVDLSRRLTALKKELIWLKDPSSVSLVRGLENLDRAYESFFKGAGYPKFKSKNNSYMSLTYTQTALATFPINFNTGVIRLPKIGSVKCIISQQYDGKLTSITITKTPTGKYFASCLIKLNVNPATKSEFNESDAIGIDLGIKTFATFSNGETIDNPRFLSKSLKALKRAQRRHDKKKKGSKNREKSRNRLARLHEKVTNQRNDFLHKVTTKLIRENQVGTICIEDLNVSGLVKNHKLARHIQDVGFGTFRQLLEYKANWYGRNILIIDRFAPSSKQCSCGQKNDNLKLSQRIWTCGSCGTTHDRDLLAAQNIVKFAFHPESINKTVVERGTLEFTPVETLALAGR